MATKQAKERSPMVVGKATFKPLEEGKVSITIGKQSTEVEYKELWGVIFVLGEGKYRDEMIPVQKKEMMVFSRKHVIKATKDIKAGETINVWCEVNIPKTIVEAIAEENGVKVIYQKDSVIPTDEPVPANSIQKKRV